MHRSLGKGRRVPSSRQFSMARTSRSGKNTTPRLDGTGTWGSRVSGWCSGFHLQDGPELRYSVPTMSEPTSSTPKAEDLIHTAVWTRQQVERVEASLARLRAELLERTEELAAERSRLRGVVDGMADGMLAVGADGRILVANQRAAALLGLPEDVLAGGETDILPAALVLVLERRATVETITIGARTLRVTCSPYADSRAQRGTVLVLHDVTREVEIDRMKSELVSIVSHELRSPLATIKGYADLLLDLPMSLDDSRRREFVEIIRRKAMTLTALVTDLLDLDRLASGRQERFPVRAEVRGLIRAVCMGLRQQAASAGLTLETRVTPSDLQVTADVGQLERVLSNLVDNAIKYAPASGSVLVWAEPRDGMVALGVTDHGPGIAPECVPHLFERFYRVPRGERPSVAGSGLGLAIVDAIVTAHSGRIEIQTAPGQGSTFTVLLPA